MAEVCQLTCNLCSEEDNVKHREQLRYEEQKKIERQQQEQQQHEQTLNDEL